MRHAIIALSAALATAILFGPTAGAWAGSGPPAAPVDTARASHRGIGTERPAADRGAAAAALVVDWNRELLHIVQTPGAQPATVHPTRSYAILQAAIYDAVVSITRDASPYLFAVNAARDARPDVAAAVAGHDVLSGLYPAMKADFDKQLASELSAIPAGQPRQDGERVGAEAAFIMLAIRAGDGSAAAGPPFVAGTQPGDYRPTPPNFPTPVFTNWSSVTPFVLKDATQYRPAAPPALASPEYAAAVNEVKSLGQDSSTTRTAEQTEIGRFWAPPIWNTWNEIAETVARAHRTDLERTAALFADLDLTFADATIAFYDAKYAYHLWRPVTAIQLAATDGNAITDGDPTWNPLATTAPDPSYPGAHSTISAAGAAVLAAFFGDRGPIAVTSDALPGVVRSFRSFRAIATEAGLSRIYAGQHSRLDDVSGQDLGRNVAGFVLANSGVAVR